jgi:general secretion pathway protein D
MRPDVETYTVIVNQVPVRELLFSMARDAKLNLDIDSDIKGSVTMNAIDQTLPKLLDRISRQVSINYRKEGDTLHVRVDKPYLEMYDVPYLNMSRKSTGKVTVSTEISSTGGAGRKSSGGGSGGGKSRGGNNSNSLVENTSNNQFWKTLSNNIAAILGEEVKNNKGDTIETSSNIIVNRESGVMAVKATSHQHRLVQAFFDRVISSAQRQVLIEATIAEVTLSDRYQAGIDWTLVTGGGDQTFTQDLLGGNLGNSPFFSVTLTDTIGDNPLNATLRALETFGDVKVLSSPKVMALNNQTAMLKVVDNAVYFTTEVEVSQGVNNTGNAVALAVVDTQVNTVPIGFVMSVTPFIDSNDVVTMNVRPTISRIVDTVVDPNPELANASVTSEVPVIQVREIESMLKINNGDTAVIGGLMQDQINKKQTGIPFLSSIPLLGGLFSYTDDEYVKSELVIFIRPVVAHDASLTGDFAEYSKYLLDDIAP